MIGDDGLNGIVLGEGNARGEAHRALQRYAVELKDRGIILAVCSKNEEATAREGFTHPDMILRLEDISSFVANWEPKHINLQRIAAELNIGIDSLVFVDDNPAERELVRAQLPMVAVPEVGDNIEDYVRVLDAGCYFETTSLSQEDFKRARLYADNAKRKSAESSFASYDDFLKSLAMRAEVAEFTGEYLNRITQLIGKTNQFNPTTRRFTLAEVEEYQRDPNRIGLYGRLEDKFGDNGLITLVTAEISDDTAEITNWMMSCRVLKRGMENLMLDELVRHLKA